MIDDSGYTLLNTYYISGTIRTVYTYITSFHFFNLHRNSLRLEDHHHHPHFTSEKAGVQSIK